MWGTDLVTNVVDRTNGSKPPRVVLADHFHRGINGPSRSPTAFHPTLNAPDVDFRFGVRSSEEQVRNGGNLARQVRLCIRGRDPLWLRAPNPLGRKDPFMPDLYSRNLEIREASAAIRLFDQRVQCFAAQDLSLHFGEELFLGALAHRKIEKPARHGGDAT